jgi:hypothetical protein
LTRVADPARANKRPSRVSCDLALKIDPHDILTEFDMKSGKRPDLCLAIVLFAFLLVSCSSTESDKRFQVADRKAPLGFEPSDYQALGLQKVPEAWEDGMRTHAAPGTFEWWYTDTEFDDGTTIVVVFYTKKGFDAEGPAHPTATIQITYPDGKEIERMFSEEKGQVIKASKAYCDVTVGKSYLRYQGDRYVLHYEVDDLVYDAVMISRSPMWRPGTGHVHYGDGQDKYSAWLVAQPDSSVEATLTIDGTRTSLKGTGYHDHNWGNDQMWDLVDHWYWGRARIGEYKIITSDTIQKEEFGYPRVAIFMVIQNGQIIPLDQRSIKVERHDTVIHPITGKFMDNHLVFSQTAPDGTQYKFDMIRKRDISVVSFLDHVPFYQRWIAKLLGENPTYVRTSGKVKLTVTRNGESRVHQSDGLWEQMFFGNKTEAKIWN